MSVVAAKMQMKTTTVRLPARIYDQARWVVENEKKGAPTKTISLNDLIVTAITAYLKLYKRRQIDALFAGMAEDADYQKQAKLLAEEFEASDWEALRLEERDLDGDELYELAGSAR